MGTDLLLVGEYHRGQEEGGAPGPVPQAWKLWQNGSSGEGSGALRQAAPGRELGLEKPTGFMGGGQPAGGESTR